MLERVFAPGHGLSQLVTSFVASESQGILHVPFSPFLIFWSFFACLRGLSYFVYTRVLRRHRFACPVARTALVVCLDSLICSL